MKSFTFYLSSFILIFAGTSCSTNENEIEEVPTSLPKKNVISWATRADSTFNSLNILYWNNSKLVFNTDNKKNLNTQNYWWQAHALDAIIDAAFRLDNPQFKNQVKEMIVGFKTNISPLRNNDFYDDREWMALALLRAFELTKEEQYMADVLGLWGDIKKGWNENHGGGIAWQEDKLYYKNAPSNYPAAILAFRLFKINGDASDLIFGKKIMNWMESSLVDPMSGIVWDGIGRNGDNEIDGDQSTEKFWRFTYNQGVYIGALVELYNIEKDRSLLTKAKKNMNAIISQLVGPSGIVEPEGSGDGGLFKGIMVRYITQLALVEDLDVGFKTTLLEFLVKNGIKAWDNGKNNSFPFIFNKDWRLPPATNPIGNIQETVDLTVALSGVFLMESLAQLEKAKLVKLE